MTQLRHSASSKFVTTLLPHLGASRLLNGAGTTFPACCSDFPHAVQRAIDRSHSERRTSKGANMRVSMQHFARAVLTASWLLFVPGANAQNQSASPNISDQKLDAAAAALDRVVSIKQNYEQQMATAAPSDKDRIAGDANNAMKKAVTDQGLSVDEYTSILRVAQNDPGVREKLLQRLPSPAQ
jgi:hypothetical protein